MFKLTTNIPAQETQDGSNMKPKKQLAIGILIAAFAFLAIAAFPPTWNGTQFQTVGGVFSHTNNGNLGTNMTHQGQFEILNSGVQPAALKMMGSDGDAGETIEFFNHSNSKRFSFLYAAGLGDSLFFRNANDETLINISQTGVLSIPFGADIGNSAILLNSDGSITADGITVNGLTSGVTTVAELSITQSVSMNDSVAGTLVLSTNVIGRSYRVQTTDDIGTILASIPLPSESAITMTVDITGAQNDYSNVNGYSFIATGRNNGGTSAMVGAETQLHEVEDQVSWNAQTAVDDATDTIRVLVQGAAATTVNWSCTVRLTWIK